MAMELFNMPKVELTKVSGERTYATEKATNHYLMVLSMMVGTKMERNMVTEASTLLMDQHILETSIAMKCSGSENIPGPMEKCMREIGRITKQGDREY